MTTAATDGSLTSKAFWLIAARILSFVVTFAVPLLLVRRLAQYDYGVYKQVFLLLATITSYGTINFPMSSYYFFPRHPEHRAVVMNVLVFLASVGALTAAVFGFYPQLASLITGSRETVPLAPLLGVTIAFTMAAYFLETLTVLRHDVRLYAVIVLGSAISKGILMVGAAWIFSTVSALLWASLLQSLLQTAILLAYVHRRYPGFLRYFDRALFASQLRYAWPFALIAFTTAALTDLHSYVVSKRFGAADFAIYAVGCLQIPLTAILIESTGPLLIRQISILQSEDRREEIARLVLAATRKLAFVFFPLAACLIVIGREFLTLLFTRQYLASYPVFVWNLLLIPLSVLLVDPIARAYPERQGVALRIRIALVAVLILLFYPFMSWFGPLGAMILVVLVTLFERLLLSRFWLSILGWPRLDRRLAADIAKLAAAAVLAGLPTEALRRALASNPPWVALLACSAVYGLAYLVLTLTLAIVSPEEKQLLRARFARWS